MRFRVLWTTLSRGEFDVSLSFEALPNGNVRIAVHIADVTHFVKAGTALDKEARSR